MSHVFWISFKASCYVKIVRSAHNETTQSQYHQMYRLHRHACAHTHIYSYRYTWMTLSVSIPLVSAQNNSGRDGVILVSNQNLSTLQRKNPQVKFLPWGSERDIHRKGKADRGDEQALLCISSNTTSWVKGTNTFVLSALKVQSLRVEETVLQRKQQDKKVSFSACTGFEHVSLLGQILFKDILKS